MCSAGRWLWLSRDRAIAPDMLPIHHAGANLMHECATPVQVTYPTQQAAWRCGSQWQARLIRGHRPPARLLWPGGCAQLLGGEPANCVAHNDGAQRKSCNFPRMSEDLAGSNAMLVVTNINSCLCPARLELKTYSCAVHNGCRHPRQPCSKPSRQRASDARRHRRRQPVQQPPWRRRQCRYCYRAAVAAPPQGGAVQSAAAAQLLCGLLPRR